jgi:hypothetical protein
MTDESDDDELQTMRHEIQAGMARIIMWTLRDMQRRMARPRAKRLSKQARARTSPPA